MLNKLSKIDLETGNTFFIYLLVTDFHTSHSHTLYVFSFGSEPFNKIKEICCIFLNKQLIF